MKLRLQKTRTFRIPVAVATDAPFTHEGVQERNPFNLMIDADATREGGVQIRSALVISLIAGDEDALHQF